MYEIQYLINRLDDADYYVRCAAKFALLEMGDSAIEPVIAVMRAGQGRSCWEAADLLGRRKDPRALMPLAEAARSINPVLAQLAVRSLQQYGADAVPILIDLLPNAVIIAQLQIVVALEKLGDCRASDALVDLLRSTSSSSLRHTIIGALAALGRADLVPVIAAYLDDPDAHVRKRAAAALETLTESPPCP